jgi:hypothetical protein
MFDASSFRIPARQTLVGLHVLSTPVTGHAYHRLQSSLPLLWPELSALGPVIVQVRHRYARLITRLSVPALHAPLSPDPCLHLRPAHWGECLLRPCACPRCQCPPSVRLHDRFGGEFLQICAPPDLPRASWHALSRHFASPVATPLHEPDESGGTHLALLPSRHGARHAPDTLPPLLALLSAHDEPIAITINTPGASLSRRIQLKGFSANDPVLTLADSLTTLQIARAGIHGLALASRYDDATPHIHLIGPGNTSLLTLSPAGGRPAAYRWLAIWRSLRA